MAPRWGCLVLPILAWLPWLLVAGEKVDGAAIYKNGVVEVIPSDLGPRLMPSVVAFTHDGAVVGEAARPTAGGNG
eukprot:Skav204456  [mRNA]  locus=scaffold1298:389199:390384:+ [translate_table: standard]